MTLVEDFDNKFRKGMEVCGFDFSAANNCIVAAGVSGGADSISLLTSLSHCLPLSSIKVITVNHNIRPEVETCGDADFVVSYCKKLGVDCFVHEIKRGDVDRVAKERNAGIEEAARYLRYEAFGAFAKKIDASFFCLAHNRNDQIETVVMRFLQGSGDKAASGINLKRDIFIRPLLYISRKDIEDYLIKQNISWRTDKTNFDLAMLRNRIRNSLVPSLNKLVPGWDKSVLSGVEKNNQDSDFIDSAFEKVLLKNPISADNGFSYESFCALHLAIRRRIVYRLVNNIKKDIRLPFGIVNEICHWPESALQKEKMHIEISDVRLFVWNNYLYADIIKEKLSDCGFLQTVCSDGIYDLPIGNVSVSISNDELSLSNGIFEINVQNMRYPFVMRTFQNSDTIKTASNGERQLSKIFSSWHVSEENRWKIAVIQELQTASQNIVAIWGKTLGYSDWIVKDWSGEVK
ncbi:MAG: tRNA lysidine(34) synthetase TilS [Treponema sp.]|nr:tRNA lysidine(34) synthetase TilS [Treponema sp.]